MYEIEARDCSPIVIGGIGGSGTRLVTQLLQKEGVFFGGDKNEELDNLWFSLLFVDRTIFTRPEKEIARRVWLFVNAMRRREPVPDELSGLLDEAALYDRGPALRKAVLEAARKSIVGPGHHPSDHQNWGWKQPNVQVLIPLLHPYLPEMKYIYVIRNGLDMAFGYNQNQLRYFWGDLLLNGNTEPTPRNALRYWVASYKRNCGYKAILGDRLYILNFDQLCRNPLEEVANLNDFLGLKIESEKLETVAESIIVPDSMGRYEHHDCRQLCDEDVEFVESLGFEVKIVP